jgi:molecular chaperone GrpE
MTSDVFNAVMKRFGVELLDPIGEKFNPNIHEALFMGSDKDKA